MRRILIGAFLGAALLTSWGAAAAKSVPLLALWQARAGHENTIWMEQRAKIGEESVTGYIQATGGADDAMIAFQLEDSWDMLTTTIGFKKGTPTGRDAEFSVEVDGQVVYTSGLMKSDGPSQNIRVPLKGHKRVLLRITSEHYNGTSGACWGEPMLLSGLSAEEMKSDWTLDINNVKTTLPGANAPAEVQLPFDVPVDGEVQYTVTIRRDNTGRAVVVRKEKAGN